MPRKTKEEKRIETLVNAAFAKHSPGNPINIFDISKVMKAGEDAVRASQDVDEAVKAAFAKYRQPY